MKRFMNWKHLGTAGLTALALAAAGVAHAASDDEQARRDLEQARQEVEKARAELQRATRDLARSMAKVERDNPRAQYFEYMTNPDRAVLGVLIPDDLENGEDRGVRLLAVTPGSGAEKVGLKAGDLLTSLNGSPLTREGKRSPQKRMRDVMRTLKAGDVVKLEYERDGRRATATATTQPPEADLAMTPLPTLQEWIRNEDFGKFGPMAAMPMLQFRGPAIRGLELARLDEDLGAYFKTTEGVLVVRAPKSGALSLKSGDVIQKIDGAAVTEPVTVLDKLRSRSAEQTVKLEILRQGRKMELEGKIPVADARPGMQKRRAVRVIADETDDDGAP